MTSKPFLPLAAALLAVLAWLAWPALALAKDPESQEATKDVVPQNNEVAFDVDATFAKHGDNDSDLTLAYTWLPGALNKNDEVVAPLRRFVRQPLEIGGKVVRAKDTTDTITGVFGFAQAWLGGVGYGKAEAGVEFDQVVNDSPNGEENAFIAGNARVEAGARVLPLLQLGGFYRYRPVLTTLPQPNGLIGIVQERSGQTQELGATLGFATPEDRLLVTASAGFRIVDWTFTGRFPGTITGRAPFGSAKISVQLSPSSSFYIRADVTSTDWNNQRAGQAGAPNDTSLTHRPAEMTRLDIRGDIGYVFWFEGRLAFRVSLGGGYYSKGPLSYQDFESGLARLGVGFITRY